MGLLRGLVMLPVAPVRGVLWVAARVAEAAELERGGDGIRRRLLELEELHDQGELTDEQLAQAQDDLLAEMETSPDEGKWR